MMVQAGTEAHRLICVQRLPLYSGRPLHRDGITRKYTLMVQAGTVRSVNTPAPPASVLNAGTPAPGFQAGSASESISPA
jgi:hypothetical protein